MLRTRNQVPKINKILEGLYVSNLEAATDKKVLDQRRIAAIVSVLKHPRPLFTDKCYLCIAAEDVENQFMMPYFAVTNEFIHSARLRGHNVLVHCNMGISRSITIVVAYMMAVTHLNWKQALHFVRAKRPIANPNRSFREQLEKYQSLMVNGERARLSFYLQARDERSVFRILRESTDLKDQYYDKKAVDGTGFESYDAIEEKLEIISTSNRWGTTVAPNAVVYEPLDVELFQRKYPIQRNVPYENTQNQPRMGCFQALANYVPFWK